LKRILPLLLLFVCGIRLYAQAEHHTKESQEQTDFGVEDKFQRPVPLPADALQSLRASKNPDDLLQECAENEGITPAEIPASWFVASEIRLSRTSSALIVRGEHECLRGAHIAQFWALEKTKAGYRIIFRGRADGMGVLATRTNGYRDLELLIVTQAGAYVEYVKFGYSKGEYRVAGSRMEHPN
jgi:hypothetical protein